MVGLLDDPEVSKTAWMLIQCSAVLGVDFPFFSAIVLFKNQPFPQSFGD